MPLDSILLCKRLMVVAAKATLPQASPWRSWPSIGGEERRGASGGAEQHAVSVGRKQGIAERPMPHPRMRVQGESKPEIWRRALRRGMQRRGGGCRRSPAMPAGAQLLAPVALTFLAIAFTFRDRRDIIERAILLMCVLKEKITGWR